MNQNSFRYHTYILRFWQEKENVQEGGKWRFTLLDPIQKQQYGFSSLDDLKDFLKNQLDES